jgi:hypothetical protein
MEQPVSDLLRSGESAEKLMVRLDDLFEEYLNLLDQYQTTRQQLSTQLSSVRSFPSSSSLSLIKVGIHVTCSGEFRVDFKGKIWAGLLR